MNLQFSSFIYVILLSCVEVFGDFSLEWYAHKGVLEGLGMGIFGYIGVVYFLIKALKSKGILYINAMWDGTSALIESVAAYVLLGERLENKKQYLGLALTIAGLFLLKQKG
jgi:multidrug transporter EmrE-like cation transporter